LRFGEKLIEPVFAVFVDKLKQPRRPAENPVENAAMLAQTIAVDFVLHPLFIRRFEMLGLTKLCEAQRRHDSLSLPSGEIFQPARQAGPQQEKRSATGMLQDNVASVVQYPPALWDRNLKSVTSNRSRGLLRNLNCR